MAGLLGSMIAGAAGGYAKQRIDTLNKEEDFDFRRALQASEAEYNMQLKRAGIQLENENEEAKFNKRAAAIKEIEGQVKDPNEGKGGYESADDAEKRKRELYLQRGDALDQAGYGEEAKNRYSRADRIDTNAQKQGQLDAKRMQIEGVIANGQEKLRLQGEANTAKAEAAAAKASRGSEHKPSDGDKAYESYVQQMKSQNKKPLARYQFENWLESKKAGFKQNDSESTTIKTDEFGNKETSVTTKGKPKSYADNDPLGLFKK